MAKYKAKTSFSGVVSMYVGEVKELTDDTIVKDLIRAGFIEEVKPADKGETPKAKAEKKGAKA